CVQWAVGCAHPRLPARCPTTAARAMQLCLENHGPPVRGALIDCWILSGRPAAGDRSRAGRSQVGRPCCMLRGRGDVRLSPECRGCAAPDSGGDIRKVRTAFGPDPLMPTLTEYQVARTSATALRVPACCAADRGRLTLDRADREEVAACGAPTT